MYYSTDVLNFIYSSIEGPIVCFQVLAIVNKASTNINI